VDGTDEQQDQVLAEVKIKHGIPLEEDFIPES